MLIRESGRDEDEVLVRHYRAVWDSYGVGEEFIRPDAEQVVRDFIKAGRDHYQLAAFLALIDDNVVGSAACQLHQSPYPEVIMPSYRLLGYIWSVYVEPDFRQKGIAQQLMARRSII